MAKNKVIESFILHAEEQGCFSGESMAIEVVTTEEGSTLRMVHKNGSGAKAELSEAKAEIVEGVRELIDGFLKVLASPQHLAGDRSTTVYAVEVEWTVGSSSSKWSLRSSEVPTEVVREIIPQLPEPKRATAEARLRNYYNHAHELFSLCKQVITAHQAVGE